MMDLFTLPAKGNISANHIAPGKRGRSSVSPIMVRGGDGQVALLAGAAGSRRIVTATSFVSNSLYKYERKNTIPVKLTLRYCVMFT